ncbi:MAG TPA: hypothetical protein VFS66_11920 [Acidimicrobiia bacterium]|nr:hypothetical protein [Acidimicrobiia bacterium]
MVAFETPRPIDATVAVQIGSVHVIASARVDTTVVVNPTDPAKGLDVEAAEKTEVELTGGNRLNVKAPHPRGVFGAVLGRYGSVDVTIELPEGSAVEISNGFGDIRVDGRLAETRLKSGAGEIQVDETDKADLVSGFGNVSLGTARGDARLTTTGDLRVGHIEGNAVLKTSNGKVWIEEVDGELRVKSANGDIGIVRARSSVVARTANGSIGIGEVESGAISMQTAAGGLRVGVGVGTAAWVDARTKFGRVHNTLQATDRPGAKDRSVEISAWTGFGDITVHRATAQD